MTMFPLFIFGVGRKRMDMDDMAGEQIYTEITSKIKHYLVIELENIHVKFGVHVQFIVFSSQTLMFE